MHCTYCGAVIKYETAKFCTKCGNVIMQPDPVVMEPEIILPPVEPVIPVPEEPVVPVISHVPPKEPVVPVVSQLHSADLEGTVTAQPQTSAPVVTEDATVMLQPRAAVVEPVAIQRQTAPSPSTEGVSCKAWPEWELEPKPIGKGSYGTVYKAVRRDSNVESYAAIKIIPIPTDPAELENLRAEGISGAGTKTYLQGIVNDFVSEIRLMESMKGVQNIVSVEDYKVVEKIGEIGWDIYIRMELLKPFAVYLGDQILPEEDVIKLGCDICTALEICDKRSILHRDIKPENIFINDFGHFKLGDFGIARKMENLTSGLSHKGTFNYMAPEVANSSEYDARVDTYSLGIVLYRLLNANRLPFLETEQQLMNANERRLAVERRIRGEVLPAPCNASREMAEVILKACAFDPAMRFTSATEMKNALLSVKNGTYLLAAIPDVDKTTSVRRAPAEAAADYEKTTAVRRADSVFVPTPPAGISDDPVDPVKKPERKKSILPVILILVLILALAGGAAVVYIGIQQGWFEKESDSAPDRSEEEIAEFLNAAEKYAGREKYQKALDKINEGLKEYPDSEKLKQKAEEYTQILAEKAMDNNDENGGLLASPSEPAEPEPTEPEPTEPDLSEQLIGIWQYEEDRTDALNSLLPMVFDEDELFSGLDMTEYIQLDSYVSTEIIEFKENGTVVITSLLGDTNKKLLKELTDGVNELLEDMSISEARFKQLSNGLTVEEYMIKMFEMEDKLENTVDTLEYKQDEDYIYFGLGGVYPDESKLEYTLNGDSLEVNGLTYIRQ